MAPRRGAQSFRTFAWGPGRPVVVPARAKDQGLDQEVVPDQDASGQENQVPATQDPASQARQAPSPSETAPALAAVGWSRFPLLDSDELCQTCRSRARTALT